MKILLVSQYFWPENFRINDLATALVGRGHEVTVLTGLPNYPDGRIFDGYGFFGKKKECYNGLKIIRVPLIPRGAGGGVRLAFNYFTFALSACLLAPLLCRQKYDRILVYEPSPVTVGLPAILLRRLRKIPVFFWVQDLWPETLSATGAVGSATVLDLVGRMVKFIYDRCDRILVQSRAFIDSVAAFGINRERIVYFPNSAEAFYRPVHVEESKHLGDVMPEGFRVMFAGNIGVAQDFATILGAVERLKDRSEIQWVILGDGRMRPWVEEQIKERGLSDSITLLGRHPAEQMPHYFAHADVLLVTLKKEPIFALTIPAKVQSYLACAKPVIAAVDGEGAAVVREAGAGLVCPSEAPEALANCVLELSRMSEEERNRIGSAGRKYFEVHFERDMLLGRLEEWLSQEIEVK